jgi:hypothetical protein
LNDGLGLRGSESSLNDEVAETLALWNVEKGLGEVSGMSGMVSILTNTLQAISQELNPLNNVDQFELSVTHASTFNT